MQTNYERIITEYLLQILYGFSSITAIDLYLSDPVLAKLLVQKKVDEINKNLRNETKTVDRSS